MWQGKRPILPQGSVKWVDPRFGRSIIEAKVDLKVEWDDPQFGRSIKERHRPAKSKRLPIVTSRLESQLVVGGPMIVTQNLSFGDQGVYQFPVLQPSVRQRVGPKYSRKYTYLSVVVAPGSLIVYTGTVPGIETKRVQGRDQHLQVLKHTFITPVGRCIIHDFRVFAPA